jgi:Lon protease-like protein
MAEFSLDLSEPIALFPLPQCVLLPHATIPLHIFEPRYRKMMQDVLLGRRVLAMAVFAGEEWKSDYQGTPALREHVCIGRLVRHEKLADGRFNILLQGVCRARIEQEVPHQPYRRALLETIEQDLIMDIDLSEQRHEIEDLLTDNLLKQLTGVTAIQHWLNPDIPTTALIDLATMTLCEQLEGRYRMLSEPDPQKRADWLVNLLRQTQRTLRVAQRFAPPAREDDVSLN